MEATKNQIINGAIQYAKGEVIAKIPDKVFRMGLSAIVALVEIKPQILDKYLEHPLVKVMASESGAYDLDLMEEVAQKVFAEYGDLPITIKTNTMTDEKNRLTFTVDDVSKLKEYIERG